MMRVMKIYFGYIWGIWYSRTSNQAIHLELHTCDANSLDDCISYAALLKGAGLREIYAAGVKRGIPKSVPLDVVVNDTRSTGHGASDLCERHQWRGPVPSGSLCPISENAYVFTPAICMLQIASIAATLFRLQIKSDFLVVIIAQLGCELCGQYSLSETSKNGHIQRKPLTNVGELARVAITYSEVRGSTLMRQSIEWIIDNLRSPMETQLFLLLCLPPRLGGFGLPAPLSNYPIDVRRVRTGFFLSWKDCTVDLYWPQFRLIVEYDSDQFHKDMGPEKVEHDHQRAEALRELGYTVIVVEHDDIYRPKLCREKGEEIASAMHEELPASTPEFIEANTLLRSYLLHHDRWI